MARTKGSQRGVIRIGASLVLAAIGALLGATGCSSDENSSEGVGSVEQALLCGKVTCPTSDCNTYKCNQLGTACVANGTKPDLAQCSIVGGAKGVCGGGQCCVGCVRLLKPSGYACEKGSEVTACGRDDFCVNCAADTCADPICDQDTFMCVGKKYQDGVACSDDSGTCFKGSCCQGCIDKTTDACVLSDAAHCGVSIRGLVSCKPCDDSETCTADSCDANGECQNAAVPDTTLCVDQDKCNGDEKCKGGACQPAPSFSCDDMNACTAESCDAQSGCAHQKLTGTACLDANKCNGAESCNDGVCTKGTDLDCEDNNACTNDNCLPGSGCSNTKKVDGTLCVDNNKCNGDEKCSNGACGKAADLNCNDNNPCTDDDCDPATGCTHKAVAAGTPCEDGNQCNGAEACSGTVCQAGAAVKCDDGDVCTNDACDPASGCKYTNNTADCSDNDPCTTTDKCAAGSCVGTGAPNCDDNEDCTADSCAKGKGCQHNPLADDSDCNDENGCTTTDKCLAGKCKGSGGPTCDDSKQCTKNSCSVANGCSNPNETNGTPCVFDKCHQDSTCQAGDCTEGQLVDCDDANPCTTDSCDPATGCKHVADNVAMCSDGELCTSADKCKSTVCIGTDVTCPAPSECFEPGTCGAATGNCSFVTKEDGTPCSVGQCEGGVCKPGPTGEGGAGGEPGSTSGGDGTGGSAVAQGGEPATGMGGEPGGPSGTAGEPGEPGKGGSSTAGSTSNPEGGAPEIPEHPFVRTPGGCSCNVPGSGSNTGWLAVAGLLVFGAAARRRREGRGASRHG